MIAALQVNQSDKLSCFQCWIVPRGTFQRTFQARDSVRQEEAHADSRDLRFICRDVPRGTWPCDHGLHSSLL